VNGKRLAPLLSLLFFSTHAWARVGGGHAFSGGHTGGGGYSSGSGGGGGGAGAYFLFDAIFRMIGALIQLTFTHPLIGLPIDAIVIFVVWKIFQAWGHPGYDITNEHGYGGADQAIRKGRIAGARVRLNELRSTLDPNFSSITLLDFLHALYSTVHHARAGRLEAYSAYLSADAIQALRAISPGVREIQGVVLGHAGVIDVGPIAADQPTRITVEFEACYTETAVTGQSQNWYARETWNLSRKAGVLSREPARVRQIACPACGAPANADAGGKCPACGNIVRSGELDWFVDSISASREARPPQLSSDSGSAGLGLPTLVDPSFGEARSQLEASQPDFKWDALNARASFIFTQLQKAWTERKWEVVRPFESDAIFESHSYWIQEYKRQKLVNRLADIRLAQMIPVKVEQDRFFSAITLRMVASMVDCTQTEDGKVLSGDPSRPHPFTEYWTLIRGKSAQPPKPGAGPLNCPACGAALKINMAGTCEYCQAKITSGDFDWVLSSIEQDEAYSG
jgi:hypothetical protein